MSVRWRSRIPPQLGGSTPALISPFTFPSSIRCRMLEIRASSAASIRLAISGSKRPNSLIASMAMQPELVPCGPAISNAFRRLGWPRSLSLCRDVIPNAVVLVYVESRVDRLRMEVPCYQMRSRPPSPHIWISRRGEILSARWAGGSTRKVSSQRPSPVGCDPSTSAVSRQPSLDPMRSGWSGQTGMSASMARTTISPSFRSPAGQRRFTTIRRRDLRWATSCSSMQPGPRRSLPAMRKSRAARPRSTCRGNL